MRRSAIVSVGLAVSLLAACSSDPEADAPSASPSTTSSAPTTSPTPSPTPSLTPSSTPTAEPVRRVSPDDVRVATAVAAVEHLAGRIGPRPGTSPAYRRAARWVQGRLEELGWTVEQQPFRTPAGVSWGVPVRAGRSTNVVATRGDVRPGRPWLLVGAHLDTVPQAPGAEDNASGVGALLAVAEALDERRARMPVVLVAFGSEEPRGPGEAHHYGSRAYVAGLSTAERGSLNGMVSLDRVGVGSVLPVGSAGDGDPVQQQLLEAAERAGVPTVVDTQQRSSDHWSFVRAGLPGARLGSTCYAAYHSAADVPSVVSRDQLRRTARTVVAWLR
ncbi:M20/M25/M40 family metallo-hydrolase [Nocardioides sp. IC4_145]|uniref:M28 family metallopeptidase n=1 Tax=Nocardioides sp. IC4_145 TaxID=2714037 RepID=UPI00140C366C|nr:M28 family peptidase [Nocardioides sp. IC4_145]NHC25379.1 M20/M25/M40 family metallo-hydrolase [Nocardioides sp. IC4_145]